METKIEQEQSFYKLVLKIALPVTLQSLLQSSFSVIDQVMTGQLGSYSIAGIGLGGKFSSIYSVLVSTIAAVAGIMIAQYMGKRDSREVSRSFYLNMLLAVCLAVVFTGICIFFPKYIMGIYTKDVLTRDIAAGYLQIIAFSYLPMAVTTLFATLLRCMEAASLPLYASVFSAVVNTGLNYLLIFGKLGLPRLEVKGAAIATVLSQIAGCAFCVVLFFLIFKRQNAQSGAVLLQRYGKECSVSGIFLNRSGRNQYLGILLPILACEFFWSLGENVYTAIYGNMGTDACAAMTLTIPIQVLTIGALSGLSQAAAILIGKSLGGKAYEKAYQDSKKLMWCGLAGSVFLSLLLAAAGRIYVQVYQVEEAVRSLASQILIAFALISPVKVQNMILGGGILRSGGKTRYVMVIDFVGTWLFGVPLGLLAALVLKFPIPFVYFILSLEECVRFGISLAVFRKKGWMESIGSMNSITNEP